MNNIRTEQAKRIKFLRRLKSGLPDYFRNGEDLKAGHIASLKLEVEYYRPIAKRMKCNTSEANE